MIEIFLLFNSKRKLHKIKKIKDFLWFGSLPLFKFMGEIAKISWVCYWYRILILYNDGIDEQVCGNITQFSLSKY